MTDRSVISLVALAAIVLGACSQQSAASTGGATTSPAPWTATPSEAAATTSATSRTNPDGTITDGDGFVRFPGEPTRPDQEHYYVVEDICGQFTQPFMERLTGKTFKKVEPPTSSSTTTYACNYFTATQAADGKDAYILLVLDYLNVANQKIGQVALGRTVSTNASIPMDNFVATQENGVVNAIYFVLGPDKFLRLDRTSTSALTDTDVLALAVKLGNKMRDFR